MSDREFDPVAAEEELIFPRGGKPTEDQLFYKEQGRELAKGEIAYLRDLLYKFVTLDAALMAAVLVFVERTQLPRPVAALVFACFLISLGLALWGLLPLSLATNLMAPVEVKANLEKAAAFKSWRLFLAAVALGVGFAIALAGIVVSPTDKNKNTTTAVAKP